MWKIKTQHQRKVCLAKAGATSLFNGTTHYEKNGVLQLAYNSIFELQSTLASHRIYMPWVLMDKLHNCKVAIHRIYNATHFQLLFNSIIVTSMMSCWRH